MQLLRPRVYADAAASTPLSRAARAELKRLIPLYGNPGGLHKEAVAAKNEFEAARESVAVTLGAHPDEIIFTGSGTEANNLAILGTLRKILREVGDVDALTTVIEHPSVLEPFAELEPEGLNAIALPVDENGLISIEMLKESITDKTALVSVQMINSEVGTIQNIKEIAKVIRHVRRERISRSEGKTGPSGPERPSGRNSFPLYFHTDASQAPLWIKLGVEQLGIDMMTLDGQKIMGPKGMGVLYVRRGTELEPVVLGGGQEKGKRSGTENVMLAGSFAVALAEAQEKCEQNTKMISFVRDFLISEIKKEIPTAVLNGAEAGLRVANNCNMSFSGTMGEMIVLALDAEGIAASTRSACAAGDEEPSHVIVALGTPEYAKCAVRLTLLPTATMTDARYIAHTLGKVVRRYRNVIQ